MALLGTLDPRQQQAQQQAAITAQSQHWEDELTKMLREHSQQQGQFTSPWQVAGQWAQALSGRMHAGQNAQNYAALNANLAPGGEPGAAPPSPGAQDTGTPTSSPEAPAAAPGGKHGGTPFSPEVKQAILEGSQAAGVDPNEMAMYAHIESDGKPNAHKEGSKYKGLMQLSDAEMAEHSGAQGNVWNPKDATMAAALISKRNGAAFEKFTGRPSTPFDRYMMHQQGAAGYLQHIGNPNGLAVDNMAAAGEKHPHDAITGNFGRATDTSAQFIGRWRQKFDRMAQGDLSAFQGGQQTAQAPTSPGAPATAGAPGAAPGASASPGLMETGHFVDANRFPNPQPTYDQAHISELARRGMLTPEQIDKFQQDLVASRQPRTLDVPGGKVILDPKTGQQTYKPDIQTKSIKFGDVDIPVQFYLDSKGVPHTLGGLPAAAPGGAPGGAPSPTSGETTAPNPDEDLAAAIASGDVNRISKAAIARDAAKTAATEQAKIGPAVEKKAGETRAEGQEKEFQSIHTGIAGAGLNYAMQAPNINTLLKLAPNASLGTGSETMQALNRFADKIGLSKHAAAPQELFKQLATKILADQFSAIRNSGMEEGSPAAKVFKAMLDVEEKSNITDADSFPGVVAKLKRMQKVAQFGMKWADMAGDYVDNSKNHRLDNGFMKKLRKEISEADFDEGIEDIAPPPGPAAGKGPPTEGLHKEINGKGYIFRGGKWYEE